MLNVEDFLFIDQGLVQFIYLFFFLLNIGDCLKPVYVSLLEGYNDLT